MKRLINNGDIFNKYASFEKKKFRDDFVEEFNWQGHRRISGTYKGSAYSASLADNFMADSLRNDSNPKGSLLVAAKNYTDAQIANINSAPARHGYRIFLKGNFYYLVYTNKDYPFVVGNSTNVDNFTTDSNYQELRKNGYYPAGGYYSQLERSATIMQIFNNGFSLSGNIGTDKTFGTRNVDMSSTIAITKLF